MFDIDFFTLLKKELLRFYKVAFQTIAAPVLTSFLFLIVFSNALNNRMVIGDNISYINFLIPGLIMMTILQNSFANSSSSLTQSKITGNLIFILLSPISNFKIFLAYSLASTMRGMVVGFVMGLAIFFIFDYKIHNFIIVILYSFFGSITLGVLGIIAGILTEKFDQLAAFQNFIIMPMTFLAGVFYSVESLPNPWKTVSQFNPFYYIVDGFRYGFIGHSGKAYLKLYDKVAKQLLQGKKVSIEYTTIAKLLEKPAANASTEDVVLGNPMADPMGGDAPMGGEAPMGGNPAFDGAMAAMDGAQAANMAEGMDAANTAAEADEGKVDTEPGGSDVV